MKNLAVIQKYLNVHNNSENAIKCKQLSYDPKSPEFYIVAWSCGIMAMFSSHNGQCMQIYEP